MASSHATFRKLTRLGKHSYYVVVPPALIRQLGWREHQKLTIQRHGKRLVIRDWKDS